MTKKKQITKLAIIKALASEPLAAGRWMSNAGCEVCAVGAVVRQVFHPSEEMNESTGRIPLCVIANAVTTEDVTDADPKALIKAKDYMSALSCYFEQLVGDDQTATPAQRAQLIEFVYKKFPEKFTVSY